MEFKDFRDLGKQSIFFHKIPLNIQAQGNSHLFREIEVTKNLSKFINNKSTHFLPFKYILFPQEIENLFEVITDLFESYKRVNPLITKTEFLKLLFKSGKLYEEIAGGAIIKHIGKAEEYDIYTVYSGLFSNSKVVFSEVKPLEYFVSYFKKVTLLLKQFASEKERVQTLGKKTDFPSPWTNPKTEELINVLLANEKQSKKKAGLYRIAAIVQNNHVKLGENYFSRMEFMKWYFNDPDFDESQPNVEQKSHLFKKLERVANNFFEEKK